AGVDERQVRARPARGRGIAAQLALTLAGIWARRRGLGRRVAERALRLLEHDARIGGEELEMVVIGTGEGARVSRPGRRSGVHAGGLHVEAAQVADVEGDLVTGPGVGR